MLVTDLFVISISSWFNLRRLKFSKKLSISSMDIQKCDITFCCVVQFLSHVWLQHARLPCSCLWEFAQVHVHWVSGASQPSHALLSLSTFVFNIPILGSSLMSQWVNSLQLISSSFYWHIVAHNSLLKLCIFVLCVISFFISTFADLIFFPFFLMNLSNHLSVLLVFLKNQLLLLLIFAIVSFISSSSSSSFFFFY